MEKAHLSQLLRGGVVAFYEDEFNGMRIPKSTLQAIADHTLVLTLAGNYLEVQVSQTPATYLHSFEELLVMAMASAKGTDGVAKIPLSALKSVAREELLVQPMAGDTVYLLTLIRPQSRIM